MVGHLLHTIRTRLFGGAEDCHSVVHSRHRHSPPPAEGGRQGFKLRVNGFEFVISERNLDKGKWCRKSVQNGYLASTVICAPRSLGAMPGGASWTWEMGTKLQYQSRGGGGDE